MFQKNVANVSCGRCKVDLAVTMLHMFYLDVASSTKDLNVPYNMKQMLRRIFFFIINGWLIIVFNIFFDVANGDFLYCIRLFFMLQMLFFDVAMDQWSVRPSASSATSTINPPLTWRFPYHIEMHAPITPKSLN